MQPVAPVMSQRFSNGRVARFVFLLAVIATLLAASVSGMFAAESTVIGPDITRLHLDRDGADIPGPVQDARFQIIGEARIVGSVDPYLAGPHDVAGGNEGLSYAPMVINDRNAAMFDLCEVDVTLRLTSECQ